MKKTIVPVQRKRVFQEDIELKIEKENNVSVVKVLIRNLQENYPDDAKIILEAYDRRNIARLRLGDIKSYEATEQSHPLPFEVSVRAKINFRLKIIDPISYKLLGYAENLKEEKYTRALIDINLQNESVKNIYQIDFGNQEHPILYLNPKLAQCAERLKPVIAEMVFKDILNYLLFQYDDGSSFKDHKWFKFAEKLSRYDGEKEDDIDYKSTWINKVLCKFSEEKKLIQSIHKEMKQND